MNNENYKKILDESRKATEIVTGTNCGSPSLLLKFEDYDIQYTFKFDFKNSKEFIDFNIQLTNIIKNKTKKGE